jgi:hypothetical protein
MTSSTNTRTSCGGRKEVGRKWGQGGNGGNGDILVYLFAKLIAAIV